ncbi:hypothetical protein THS27_10320 [Thalassospira sp. MCCC 1A01428]|nr:hypothetical protein THS27_10320 [Thalassospira sp. MCCC 1A01428]
MDQIENRPVRSVSIKNGYTQGAAPPRLVFLMTRITQREKTLRKCKHTMDKSNICEAKNAQLLNSTAHFPRILAKNTI